MVCAAATTQQCAISQATLLHCRSSGLPLARLGPIKPQFFHWLIATYGQPLGWHEMQPFVSTSKLPEGGRRNISYLTIPSGVGVGRAFPLNSLGRAPNLLRCMSQ